MRVTPFVFIRTSVLTMTLHRKYSFSVQAGTDKQVTEYTLRAVFGYFCYILRIARFVSFYKAFVYFPFISRLFKVFPLMKEILDLKNIEKKRKEMETY